MNEWVEVINLLCEKLGIAVDSASLVAEQLVPQLVKMELVTHLAWGVIILLVFIACVIGIVKILKFMRSEDYDEYDDGLISALGVGALMCGALFAFFMGSYDVFEAIEWAVAPDIKVIEYITEMMK